MLKSKSKPRLFWLRRDKHVDVDFDFKILTAFIRLGRAGPDRGRVPSILLLFFDFDFDFDFDIITNKYYLIYAGFGPRVRSSERDKNIHRLGAEKGGTHTWRKTRF